MNSFTEATDGTKIDPLFAKFNRAVLKHLPADGTERRMTGEKIAHCLDQIIAGKYPEDVAQAL